MKPGPARLRPESYPRSKEVPIRFGDLDIFRHVNNVSIGHFYDEARFEVLTEAYRVTGSRGRLVIANFDVAYLREAKYPGTITVGTGTVRLGARSLVLGQGLFIAGKCIGTADSVVVAVDDSGGIPVPDAVASFFGGLMLPGD